MRYPADQKARAREALLRARHTLVKDEWFQRCRRGWPGRRRGRDIGCVLFKLREQGSDARSRHRRRARRTVPVGYRFGDSKAEARGHA